jgi:hypothetical protein
MNRGTAEGTAAEVQLVKQLNENSNDSIWAKLGIVTKQKLYAIHVIQHVHSDFFDRMTKPKADVYIAEGNEIDPNTIAAKNFILDENDLKPFNLKPIQGSGISVKMSDSTKFQILKTSPTSFPKIFGDSNLAAGAAIYCTKLNELEKNPAVLAGWNTNQESFIKFFEQEVPQVSVMFEINENPVKRLEVANKIKTLSNSLIAKQIESNQKISDYVFTGIGLYPEPYTAHWLFEAGIFRKNGLMPFSVTTGSGRGRGDYTIVIKPK